MRIIFLTITFYPEPNAIHGLPLAKCLTSLGHDIKVLTSFPQYPYGKIYEGYTMQPWQWDRVDGIPVLRVPIYPSHDTNALKRICTYLSFAFAASTIGASCIGPADVVYLYDPPPTNGLASMVLKIFRGIPVVQSIADMWPETVIESGMVQNELVKKTMNTLISVWCKFIYWQSEVITVLSPGFKQLLVKRGVPRRKVRVIYNWADETTFYPMERDQVLAKELGLEGRFNIVYAGNLGVFQGIETIIRAAALIKDYKEIQVVIVGMGPKEEELKRLATELGAVNLLFVGRRPYEEMPKINSLADVLLIHLKDRPFLHATIPGKTQVSLASGKPVLMAVRGDASEIVHQAEAGLVCEPDNPREMADVMVRMFLMSRSELESMGARGRDYYVKNLSLNAAAKSFSDIFYEVTGSRATGNST